MKNKLIKNYTIIIVSFYHFLFFLTHFLFALWDTIPDFFKSKSFLNRSILTLSNLTLALKLQLQIHPI